jgi:hypothetical protein
MVRPAAFAFNEQTAVSNAFQQTPGEESGISEKAVAEFDAMVAQLRAAGVDVWVIADTPEPVKPDAVFPNNWISTHSDGTIVLYPMCTPNRRLERRDDLVAQLRENYQVSRILDLSAAEQEGRFLEGTGSIVFDHEARMAYACLSVRTDSSLLQELCREIGYTPFTFHATDEQGQDIYHTNVIMGIGSGYAVLCLDSVRDTVEKEGLIQSLQQAGKAIIDISQEQVKVFAGNVLSLKNNNAEPLLAPSASACASLQPAQKAILEQYTQLLPLSIPLIESIGGGSVRCTMAQNFLPL